MVTQLLPLLLERFTKSYKLDAIYEKDVFDLVRVCFNYDTIQYDTITLLVVSMTKFLIVIGFPRAYWLRNRCAITWLSNYRYPILGFS